MVAYTTRLKEPRKRTKIGNDAVGLDDMPLLSTSDHRFGESDAKSKAGYGREGLITPSIQPPYDEPLAGVQYHRT